MSGIAKRRRKTATKSEREVAARLGGRRVPLSGAGVEKGDGRVPGMYRIENKTTERSHYSLTAMNWHKIHKAARFAGEEPLFHVRMKSSVFGYVEVVVLRREAFFPMVEQFRLGHQIPTKSIRLDAALDYSKPWIHRLQRIEPGLFDYYDVVVTLYTDFLKLHDTKEK